MMKRVIYIVLLITAPILTFGQVTSECDSIYNYADTMPQYSDGRSGLNKYLFDDLVQVFTECYNRDSSLVTSIYMILTIDKFGSVINVVFSRTDVTEICQTELKKKILTMKGWSPAEMNGKKVCCKYYWPISCILWQ